MSDMSDNNGQDGSWYEPLKSENRAVAVQTAKSGKAKGLRRLRPWGIAALVLLIIIGSSLAFAGDGPQTTIDVGGDAKLPDGSFKMPEDPEDFFKSFYETIQTDKVEINLPRVSLNTSFKLKLSESSGEDLQLQELYQNCSSSIVAITGYQNGVDGYSWGTGIILSADGLILTNTHVISSCDRATVTLYDDREFEAQLVGADAISDVAVLKIDASGLPAAEFGESAKLQVGDRVAAIGNPLGESFRMTLTDGIISAIERGISYNGHSMTLLQTNTALNEGNSGGALFNMHGQVIGMTNMKMMSSYSSIEGIGFAIPSSTISSIVEALIRDGEVKGRTSVGITVGAIPENAISEYALPEGLYVSAVVEGTDAEKKGIKPGDVITKVNGEPALSTEQIADIKNALKVGDTISFTIWRDGETFDVSVVLGDTNDIY